MKKKEQIHSEWRNVPLHKWGLIDRSKGNIPGHFINSEKSFYPKISSFHLWGDLLLQKKKLKKKNNWTPTCIKQTKKQPNKGF